MGNYDKETISLKEIFVKYLRRWKIFLIVFIISFIPALLYLNLYPITFGFKSSIQIQEEKETSMASIGLGEAAGLMKSFGIGGGGGGVNIDDEMSILLSNRILRRMILELGLNISYSRPNSFYRLYDDSPLKLTMAPSILEGLDDEYRFAVSVSPGDVNVKVKSRFGRHNETLKYTSLPAIIKVADIEFTLDHNPDIEQKGSFKLNIDCVPASWVAEDLSNGIRIEEVSSSSFVLDLEYNDHSKKRGKDILNTLLKVYNEDVASFRRIEDNKTMEFVEGRISKVLADLAQVELDIQEYKTKNNMTLLESDVTMYTENMKELQTTIVEIEAQTHMINMIYEHAKNPDNKYSLIPSIMTVKDGESSSGSIAAYNDAVMERNWLLKNSNERNETFKTSDYKVSMLREGALTTIENTRKNYDKTLAGLKAKEAQILSMMRTIPEKEREYLNYRLNQEILQALYLMLLQKSEETIYSLEKQTTDRARVIEPAYILKKPLGPRKLFAAIGMLVFTLLVPISYLLAKDLFISLRDEFKK